jgi:hypothetical protein
VTDTASDVEQDSEAREIPESYDHASSKKSTDADATTTAEPRPDDPPATDRPEAVESALNEAQERVQATSDDLNDIDSDLERLSRAHQLAAQAMEQLPKRASDDDIQQQQLDIENRLQALATARTAIDQAESLLAEPDSEQRSDEAAEVVTALADAESAVREYGTDTSRLGRLTDQVEQSASKPSDDAGRPDEGAEDEKQPLPDPFVEELRRLDDKLEKVPSYTDMRDYGEYNPQNYYDHVDSWEDALSAAGFDIRSILIEDLQMVAEELDRRPTTTEMETHGTYSTGWYQRYFANWEAALDAAGVEAVDDEILLDDLRRLHDELGRVPTGNDIESRGEFTVSRYTKRFGSLDEAIAAIGIDYEAEVLEELREVTEELGRPPKTKEFTELSEYSAGIVYKFYDKWNTALEAAGVSDSTNGGHSSGAKGGQPSGPEPLDPSPLTEYYQVLNNLRRIQESLYDGSPESHLPEDGPMYRWITAVANSLGDSGIAGWETGYGPQQQERSPGTMREYRRQHGDGDRVTEFHHIEIAPAPAGITALLPKDAQDMADLPLPVAPDSGRRLPVVVEDRNELQSARGLLREFPARPDVAGSESSESGEPSPSGEGTKEGTDGKSVISDGTEPENNTGAEPDSIATLVNIGGIDESIAEKLVAAGYEDRDQLKAAEKEELMRINGISEFRANRIKMDVGG